MILPCRVNMIQTNFFGKGALELFVEEVKKMGYKRALVVTDQFLYESKVAYKVCEELSNIGVNSFIYYGVKPNPTVSIVNEALSAAKHIEPEFIVALGGGSAIDTCKAVGIVLANGGKVQDYEGVNKSDKKAMPIAAINTTAGTGSEVTTFYVITDEQTHSKMVMVDTNSAVWVAVNDADFMTSMPKSLTAATGMDALTHALEAILSKNATPFTDKDALWAIKTIKKYLPIAVKEPENIEAREMMSYAQYSAGLAFSNAGLGMVHAMAHSLGGFYNLPHGVCNAVLLPHVMEYNSQDANVKERFKLIYEALDISRYSTNISASKAAIDSVKEIKRISKEIGIPQNLKELGVKSQDFEALASLAIKDTCMPSNPVKPSIEDVIDVYKKA